MFREGLSAPTEAPRYETRQPESYHPWPGFRVVPVLLPKDSAKAWFLSGMLHLDLRPVTHVHTGEVVHHRVWLSNGCCRVHLISAISSYLSQLRACYRGRDVKSWHHYSRSLGALHHRVVELRRHRSNTRLFWHRFGMKQALLPARNDRRPLLRFWGDDEI